MTIIVTRFSEFPSYFKKPGTEKNSPMNWDPGKKTSKSFKQIYAFIFPF